MNVPARAPADLADLADLAGREEIHRLPYDYAQAFAQLDLGALVELYVPDVALLDGERGRAALRTHFERAVRGAAPGLGLRLAVLHVGGHVVELDGPDTAHGTVHCQADVHLRNGDSYTQRVVYLDEYARYDGRWYFAAQRRHELVYGAPPHSRPNGLPPANWPASQTGRGSWPPPRR